MHELLENIRCISLEIQGNKAVYNKVEYLIYEDERDW